MGGIATELAIIAILGITTLPLSRGETLVAHGFGSCNGPTCSPDGKTILFAGSKSIIDDLSFWLVSKTGSGLRRLPIEGHCSDPAFSPNGKLIVFSRSGETEQAGSLQELCLYEAFTKKTRALRSDPGSIDGFESPFWSPDGKRIAFVHNGHVSVIDADGSHPCHITLDKKNLNVTDLAWNPGGKLAFTWLRSDHLVLKPLGSSIYTVKPDGTGLRKLATGANSDSEPSWSRDGQTIVFTRAVGSAHTIWTSTGNRPKPLPVHRYRELKCGSPSWSRDGKTMVFKRWTWAPSGGSMGDIASYGGLKSGIASLPAEVDADSTNGRPGSKRPYTLAQTMPSPKGRIPQ